MWRLFTILIAVFVFTMTSGCSGGSNPAAPDKTSPASVISSIPVAISDYDSQGNPSGGMGVLGVFSGHVILDTLTGELVSLRNVSSQDVLEIVDITSFLQLAPCTDCVKLRGIELDVDGNLVVKIGIRHPFPVGDPFKPITGRNRADLHVFNVEGIVISDGTSVMSFPGLGETVSDLRLLNADGYTGYLDGNLDDIFPTNATIHPYITHFADYSTGNFDPANQTGFASVIDPPPAGNLVMPMSSSEDVKKYIFNIPNGGFDFIFAVGCTYGLSANTKNMRFTPEYRVPQFNKKAASLVQVVIDANNLQNADTTSSAQFTIKVLDINHGVPVGEGLGEMRADSSVSAVEVEIPGVTSSPVAFTPTPTGGDGRDPSNPLTFTGTVQNSAGGVEGDYVGIVKVTDSYVTGLNESPLLNNMDGIKRVDPLANPLTGTFPITEFATYQRFDISVETNNEDPVAVLAPDPANGCDGGTIWFDGSGSYDTDGSIVLYEFDFDLTGGNPANFSADVSGVNHRAQSSVYTVGNYTAALRVTDNLGATNIDTVLVSIIIGGIFDVSSNPKTYITDTSFSGVIFTPNGFTPDQTQNHQYGLEAMATGSQYVYAVFYATGADGTGYYIARSGDNGTTWGDYNLIRALTPGAAYSGISICALDTRVYIAFAETNPLKTYLAYNANNASGPFDIYEISTSVGAWSVSVGVDPQDTNNVYVAAGPGGSYITSITVYTSHTGPAGPYTANSYNTWYRPPPFGYYTQGYSLELKVAQDQDVYLVETANASLAVKRSQDYGDNFTEIYGVWDPLGSWARDSDYCINSSNPEEIHWVTTYRVPGTYYHVYRRSLNGGVTWSVLQSNLHGTTTAYTNVSITEDNAHNLYIVYTDKSSGNGEVYGRFSSTNGQTWNSIIQITNNTVNDAEVEITTTTDKCDVIIGWLEDLDGTPRVVSIKG